MELISGWVRALVGAAVFCALAMALCPEGRVRRVLSFACGVVMAAVLLSPAAGLDSELLPRAMARYSEAARARTQAGEASADRLSRSIIEGECETYILDKAAGLGLEGCEVSVTARWSDEGFWYPWECRLSCSSGDRESLSRLIEAELGIASERQSWEAAE